MSGEELDKQILFLIANPKTEKQGFELLYKHYTKRLYWHIRKIVGNHEDADDVLQNVLIKAWKALKNFRGDASIYTWLYRIGSNECITFLNKRNKTKAVSLSDDENALENTLTADQRMDSAKVLAQLQSALDTLPEKQKQVFCMRYYDEMPYQTISEQLGTSVGALKASYHHAVNKIENYFQAHD